MVRFETYNCKMVRLPLTLIAAGAFFSLSFASSNLEEQQVLKHGPNDETLSGEEVVGVGFDLTASYG